MSTQQESGLSQSRVNKKLLIRAVKLLIVVVVVFGLWRTVQSAHRQLQQQRSAIRKQLDDLDREIAVSPSPAQTQRLVSRREVLSQQMPDVFRIRWKLVVLAAGTYLLALIPPAYFFHLSLIDMGQLPRVSDSISSHVLGHLGKYIPGKAMVVVLRVAAISGPEVRGAVATVSVFVETLVMMAVGGTLAGILVISLDMPPWIQWLAIGLALCASVPTLPPLFQKVVSFVAKLKVSTGSGLSSVRIRWALMLRGWGLMLLMWFLIGLSFFLLVLSAPNSLLNQGHLATFLLSTAAISLAMVAGFVSLLPGGAGVRELVISTILAPQIGVVPALVAAILARVTFLMVELLAGGLLWQWKRKPTASVETP